MEKTKVLVTGSKGQLGECILDIQNNHPTLNILFCAKEDFDITNIELINVFFEREKYDYLINCAAYTNVEKAEKESERAFLINAEGAKNLAKVCKKYNTTLIHISTDYVFDGNTNVPYIEKDVSNPINEYGKSKLKGEEYIQEILKKYFIIRTSWLYSQFGKNFYKTILEKSEIQKDFTITTSETGTPTNANDLANFLLQIIEAKNKNYGIYHFSNLGSATWYDFAREILKNSGKLKSINLKMTDNYPTFAKRPKHSVLSKEKVKEKFNLDILEWKESLRRLMKKNNSKVV
ncbi:dTDP-4-dehydrorhamnose reductase [Aquimarina sp. 2201CG5-10]|uniref:dTDP-4-dehydrorhamnose reductase n=1 Tax=Aquimarina callyspongiae TaxID=3098150 RepID=UPI002AB32DAD|nr:dTDP-4-dehydrorhamnose reductase [Aquimarina sp. 2201CG5-10]MDY8138668.1 dTDP-4-dehydrorhamnose reductase [Aquimarina sp. 2201CG5-10]